MFYVVIKRERPPFPVLLVGPYLSEELAVEGMEFSVVVTGLVEEDALDCFVMNEEELLSHFPDAYSLVVVEPADPIFFGPEE